VPLSVQIGNGISNSVLLPVAPAGSRTCLPTNPAFSGANTSIFSGPGPFTFAGISLARKATFPGYRDRFEGQFLRFTVPAAAQPFVLTYIDTVPLGTCQIFNNLNGKLDPPIVLVAGLDAGPQMTVQGPNGSKNVTGGSGDYSAVVSDNGTYFAPGTMTVSAPGGADVQKFSASFTLPALPTLTSPPPDAPTPTTVTRANGLTVNWSGAAPNTYVEIDGVSAIDNSNTVGASFQCNVAAAAGSFTIPSNILLALPGGNFGALYFTPGILPQSVPGAGLTFSQLTAQYETFSPLVFR
jgi:hypothetical protein